ncbi:MAG: type V CRISPR-associated endonuclease Cas1 [Bacteroidetes bacterium]|nr:type V CRISPR-associated endonuclease Cas1 [Bacteroidota bacterium]MBS1747702.1 type V CRISPR-associated endonuclease Cas1 [Bacteroidota bacterium]
MFTHKDIDNRSLFVINGVEHQRLRVSSGRLLLEDEAGTAITKLPFPKILSLLIIGHTTITTALIEHCNKHGVPLVVMKPNFRPVFYFGNMAEANYLLRKRQYEKTNGVLDIAQALIQNKLMNQHALLLKTRIKNPTTETALGQIMQSLEQIPSTLNYRELMGIEGRAAKVFFQAYFEFAGWQSRHPRVKQDTLNATLDIGYTMLFNYLECMVRLFGFDPYIGVYHQLWFRRKSLVCDLMEPFRCIIEHKIRKALKYGTFKSSDFEQHKEAWYLKPSQKRIYTQAFFEAIIEHKSSIYKYIQSYYRCFMGRKTAPQFPQFSYE